MVCPALFNTTRLVSPYPRPTTNSVFAEWIDTSAIFGLPITTAPAFSGKRTISVLLRSTLYRLPAKLVVAEHITAIVATLIRKRDFDVKGVMKLLHFFYADIGM